MTPIMTGDRIAVGALAAADVGIGLYLIGAVTGDTASSLVHAVVGVVALLLALPASVAAATGRLPAHADDGVVVNLGAFVCMALDAVLWLPGDALQRVGLAVVLGAATAATGGLYLRLFGEVRRPDAPRGKHAA